VESAEVWNGAVGHLTVWYLLAQRREALDADNNLTKLDQAADPPVDTEVFGRPATLVRYLKGYDGQHPIYQIHWQPVNGLWARVDVEANDSDTAMKAVFALKLSQSQRCVVPMHLRPLPAGYTWNGCSVDFGPAKPWETGTLSLTGPNGIEVGVSIGYISVDEPYVANTMVGSRPAQWIGQSSKTVNTLVIPVNDWVDILISSNGATGHEANSSFTEEEAMQIAALIDVGTDFEDPMTWPVNAVG